MVVFSACASVDCSNVCSGSSQRAGMISSIKATLMLYSTFMHSKNMATFLRVEFCSTDMLGCMDSMAILWKLSRLRNGYLKPIRERRSFTSQMVITTQLELWHAGWIRLDACIFGPPSFATRQNATLFLCRAFHSPHLAWTSVMQNDHKPVTVSILT